MNNSKKNQDNINAGGTEDVGGMGLKEERGYMAIYHDIEEICYGPELGLSAKERVFLCLRHKLLRDGLCQKLVGKAFIIEKTKLSPSQVETALKFLEQKEIVLVHRSKTGKTWNQNQYELHPKKFGNLYNWYKNNPTVRVYDNSKAASYSKRGLPLDSGVGVPLDSGVGVPPKAGVGRDHKLAELFEKIRSNNPSYNNPKENNPSSEKRISQKVRQRENPEEEKQRQFEMAKKAGIL